MVQDICRNFNYLYYLCIPRFLMVNIGGPVSVDQLFQSTSKLSSIKTIKKSAPKHYYSITPSKALVGERLFIFLDELSSYHNLESCAYIMKLPILLVIYNASYKINLNFNSYRKLRNPFFKKPIQLLMKFLIHI